MTESLVLFSQSYFLMGPEGSSYSWLIVVLGENDAVTRQLLKDKADLEAFRAQKVKDDEKKVARATYARGYV